jgi:class 3 adenylate cyclase/DNA-binding SARP family transcriptional activator
VHGPETLTILFTDLVGSTSLIAALGDDAADALRRSHFATLRSAVDAHCGREVKSLGDGLMVAFTSAREAVACAARMQQSVSEQADRLELRVGIDAGEPIHDGADLFGTPVVVARRLCDVATAGQVLVSDVVRMLCGSRLPLRLEELGPLQLKGLEAPVVAHAVRWQRAGPRVRLCGPLVVEQDGTRLDERLPSRQARVLFSLLVLERRRALSREAIADALWADAAPRSRDSSLRALLTGVRRVFGPASVEGRASVRLVLPDDATVDVEEAEAALTRAESAIERGDADAAMRAARHAAALTGDELLAGLSARWIDERRAEVAELALRALELEARAALECGRAPAAERAARRLVERAPYRESAYELLMRALAARDNVAEATLVYDRLRTLLRDDLGTTPSPGVVAMHDRLLAGADAVPAEPATVAAQPAGGGLASSLARAAERPFVAREQELDRVRTAWAAVRAGEGRLVLLAGEPGIGKTSVVAQFARAVHRDGASVLLGRCHAEALVPYEPFVDALRQLPGELLGEHAAVLARVMPELAPDGGASADGADDPAARYLLFDAVTRVLAAAARGSPLVLVLEDLHWAEQPTLLLLRHLARASERTRLMLLATYRTTEVPGTEHVVRSLADLERELPLVRIALGGLADADVARMIHALQGRPVSIPLGTAVRRDTAGNPLFVGQLLRHLAETGALVERGGELSVAAGAGRLGVPESAKELVATRLSALPPDAVATLRTAAVIGRGFDAELVAETEDRPAGDVLDALDAGVAAGLVEEVDAGRHAFVHAVVREAIYEQMGATRRARVHRRVAASLERSADAEPAELAHHYLAAGDRAKGLEHSVVAAQRALVGLAYEDAAAHYEHALGALGDGDGTRRCELLLALADARAREGDTPAYKRAYIEAAELAQALALPDQLARAALGYGGRFLWEVARDDPQVATLLERALAAIGARDDPLRIRLLARLGGGPLRASRDPTRRRALTAEALAAARRLADPPTLAYAIDGYISAHHSPEHTDSSLELADELIAIATNSGDLERAIEGYEHRIDARLQLGDVAGADDDMAAMARLAAELRQPAQDWFVADRQAVRALHSGHLDEAEQLVEQALHVGREATPWNATVTHSIQHVVLRRLQGRLAEAEAAIRAAAEEQDAYLLCRCAHLHVLAELGESSAARTGLAALAPDAFGALHFDETWLASVAFLAEAAHRVGDAKAAAALYRRLLPYADRVATSAPEVSLGAVVRYLGLLAATCGDEAADRHLEDAVAANERLDARPWAALALHELALLRGDRGLAAEAAAAFARLGMDVLADRAGTHAP